MTQPSDVLTEAAKWIGYREQPDGSNDVDPITPWWPMSDAWCACFVSFVFSHAGLPLGPRYNAASSGFIWCSDGADWFREQDRIVRPEDARPGDVLFFEWGSTAGGYDHTGVVVENTGWGLTTIEGNVGNRVDVFTRYYSECPEVGRPAWDEPDDDDGDDMAYDYSFADHAEAGEVWLVWGPAGQPPRWGQRMRDDTDIEVVTAVYHPGHLGKQGPLIDRLAYVTPVQRP